MTRPSTIRRFLALSLLFILSLGIFMSLRPLPPVNAVEHSIADIPSQTVTLPWPGYGQAAIGAAGFGVLASHGEQKPAPMASITKLVTALTVLKQKPLKPGEQGPIITLGESDVAYYPSYLSRNGAVIPVAVGEQLSEHKVLEAMLIPSANNMADSLATWAFGSIDNYLSNANAYLKSHGFINTHVADASGFSPQSVSTASELVKLGIIAMQDPVISSIVGQSEAQIPLAGTIHSTNRLLGLDGIVGIKTGNTDEAGGCYLFAAKHRVGDKQVMIIGANMGAASLSRAISDSRQLLAATKTGFSKITPIQKGQLVGSYSTPWRETADIVAKDNIELIVWQPDHVKIDSKLKKFDGNQKDSSVGVIEVSAGSQVAKTDAVLKNELKPPSAVWRLLR